MSNRIYLYPRWLRLWHVINAIMCLMLIITGVSIQYSTQKSPLIGFDHAIKMHNVAGIVLLANYIIFFIGNFISSNRKHYVLHMKGIFARLTKQIMYYTFGIFKGESAPYPTTAEQKFNPIQQVTYIFIMYIFVPLAIVTGSFMFFPENAIGKVLGLNSFVFIDVLHIMAGFLITLFLLIHLYFATIGHTIFAHFKSIINGYHEEH